MKRLGYTKFVAQGGDWGNCVTELMALQTPPGLLGIHTNMPATVPGDIDKAAFEPGSAAVQSFTPTKRTRTTNSPFSISTALATPSRWRIVRRRYTESRIRPSVSRHGYLIMTSAAMSSSPAYSTEKPKVSRETTSSITSHSTG